MAKYLAEELAEQSRGLVHAGTAFLFEFGYLVKLFRYKVCKLRDPRLLLGGGDYRAYRIDRNTLGKLLVIQVVDKLIIGEDSEGARRVFGGCVDIQHTLLLHRVRDTPTHRC